MQTRDEVDAISEDSGHDKGVAGCGDDVGDLDVELLPVVFDPAGGAVVDVDAVEADDVGGAEEGVEDEADHAGDAVLGEDVHAVVDADPVLDCGLCVSNSPKAHDKKEGLLLVEKLATTPVTMPRTTAPHGGM